MLGYYTFLSTFIDPVMRYNGWHLSLVSNSTILYRLNSLACLLFSQHFEGLGSNPCLQGTNINGNGILKHGDMELV
jgi:hypothetical protein